MNQKKKRKHKQNKVMKATPTLRQRGSDVTGHVSTVTYRYQLFGNNLNYKTPYKNRLKMWTKEKTNGNRKFQDSGREAIRYFCPHFIQ